MQNLPHPTTDLIKIFKCTRFTYRLVQNVSSFFTRIDRTDVAASSFFTNLNADVRAGDVVLPKLNSVKWS